MAYEIGPWTVHLMNARGRLSPYADRLREALGEVARRAEGLVPGTVLDIEVEAARFGGVPETGHSGYAPRPGLMRLTLDPENERLADHLGEPLERMIAHELHHALRWDAVGYGTTLLGALASEGLSGQFARELYGSPPEPWERALDGDALGRVAREAVRHADDESYDHPRWFFGAGDLPNWAGYTLGYRVVERAMAASGSRPSAMIAVPAQDFRPSLEALATG